MDIEVIVGSVGSALPLRVLTVGLGRYVGVHPNETVTVRLIPPFDPSLDYLVIIHNIVARPLLADQAWLADSARDVIRIADWNQAIHAPVLLGVHMPISIPTRIEIFPYQGSFEAGSRISIEVVSVEQFLHLLNAGSDENLRFAH